MKTPEVGDEVQYKASFLKSIGVVSGDLAHARGKITKIDDYGVNFRIAHVDWDLRIPPRSNVANLKVIDDWEPN